MPKAGPAQAGDTPTPAPAPAGDGPTREQQLAAAEAAAYQAAGHDKAAVNDTPGE